MDGSTVLLPQYCAVKEGPSLRMATLLNAQINLLNNSFTHVKLFSIHIYINTKCQEYVAVTFIYITCYNCRHLYLVLFLITLIVIKSLIIS